MSIIWTLYVNKFGNLEEMDNFLETHTLNQEEIGDLKRPITRSEIESVIKKKTKNKKNSLQESPGPDGFTSEF